MPKITLRFTSKFIITRPKNKIKEIKETKLRKIKENQQNMCILASMINLIQFC